jgi:hypothetical protein
MSKLPSEAQARARWFVGGTTLGGVGLLVAFYFHLDLLLWISFGLCTVSFLGLTATVVYYTTIYLNEISRRE